MARDHAVFLRGISHVSMEPLRVALSGLGLTDVASFGASGNLAFCAPEGTDPSLEERIVQVVGAAAFVRTREELSAIVAEDPYRGLPGAGMFFAAHPPDAAARRELGGSGFEGDPPVVSGATVYFVHPTRRSGRKGVVDFERELSVQGTMRASRVVGRVLDMM